MTTESVSKPLLKARQITKAYGATRALRGVDFTIEEGKITALIGENGAGKSTLMKILAGVEQPSSGMITMNSEKVVFNSPTEAAAHGVSIIHQELNLVPNLSISDNIFLGRELHRGDFIDYEKQKEIAREALERLEEPLDPGMLAGDLRLGQQQLVEIARSLTRDTKVLIMDEPTSALSHAEVQILFRVMRDLASRGVAIIYISHHLDECLEIADHAVILRDGLIVAKEPMADVDLAWIITNMVGRDQDDLYSRMEHRPGEVLLSVEDVVVADPGMPGRVAVQGVNFELHEGEVVGIYGLMGAGRTELLEAIAGRNALESGRILLDGQDIKKSSIADRISSGVILVPEDRQRDGLVQALSVGANLALAAIEKLYKGGFISSRLEKEQGSQVGDQVRLKAASLSASIGSLSGGNQQKVVIGKAMMTSPRVLVLDEPTRGIDVGAKADIFGLMASEARKGRAVLFATSEVGEVLNACDRILVMSRGKLVADLYPHEVNRESLMTLADSGSIDEDVK